MAQFFNLVPAMAAADDVMVPLFGERVTRPVIDERVGAALDAVGLRSQCRQAGRRWTATLRAR